MTKAPYVCGTPPPPSLSAKPSPRPRVTLFSPSPSPPTATPCASSPAGHTALLVVAADLLQSPSRGDHPELIEPLHALITSVAR